MGYPAMYGGASNGFLDPFVDVRVEGVGDELRLGGQFGDGLGGPELHGDVDLTRPAQERLNREDTQLMERVYNRVLDPISASERIFKEF